MSIWPLWFLWVYVLYNFKRLKKLLASFLIIFSENAFMTSYYPTTIFNENNLIANKEPASFCVSAKIPTF